MIAGGASIELAFKGFKAKYTDAYSSAETHRDKVAMTVPPFACQETYGWLGQFPQLREWLGGDRVVKNLAAHAFTLENRKFESTVGVKREDFLGDRLGVFAPMMAEMGHLAALHPEEMIFGLLASSFTNLCFDGQPFFDADHPSTDKDGNLVTVSNVAAGAATPWFLLDTSRAVKPLVWQEREKYDFQKATAANDHHVFMTDEYLFGVRARVNAGYGLWQMAYASQQPLTPANYAAARAQM